MKNNLVAIVLILFAQSSIAQRKSVLDILKANPVPKGTFYTMQDAVANPTKVLRLVIAGENRKAIPSDVLKFTNLIELDVSYNKIQDVPKWIMKLRKLSKLNMMNNNISYLPDFIFSSPTLRYINLWGNNISSINFLNNNYVLEDISLSQNKFTVFPTNLIKLKKLKRLTLDNNKLTSLPPEAFELNELEYISLMSNDIVDINAVRNIKLKTLNLESNHFFNKWRIPELQKSLPNCKIFTE